VVVPEPVHRAPTAAPCKLIADLHGADSYRRWRRRQLERIPGAFVPDPDLGDRDAPARAGWSNSTRSGGPPTTPDA
jgi:hypothetical protein